MRHAFAALTCIALLLCALPAFAHGDRPSYEKQIGPYLLDIGYSHAPVPGQPVTFDFDLYTNTGADVKYAPFTDVHISISKDGTSYDTANMQNKQPAVPTFTYTFPSEGVYIVAVSYDRKNADPLQTSFDLRVSRLSGWIDTLDNASHYVVAGFLLVVAIVVFTIMFLQRRR